MPTLLLVAGVAVAAGEAGEGEGEGRRRATLPSQEPEVLFRFDVSGGGVRFGLDPVVYLRTF